MQIVLEPIRTHLDLVQLLPVVLFEEIQGGEFLGEVVDDGLLELLALLDLRNRDD